MLSVTKKLYITHRYLEVYAYKNELKNLTNQDAKI